MSRERVLGAALVLADTAGIESLTMRRLAMKPGYDYSEEFEFGLDLILDGLQRLRDNP